MTKDKNIIYGLALLWLILATIQAAFTGLIHDEAYYWVYSKNLDWGFFDHPPAVAWYIIIGDSFLHSSLGLRLTTILSSTLVFLLLWDLLKGYGKRRPVLFALLMFSMPLLTALSFMTVPDTPLLLGMVLFLWLYKRFLRLNDWGTTILWGMCMAFLLYSKYHGILVIGFTVLSNLRLLKDKKFWAAGLVGVLFFTPHIWWQIDNEFVSFKFHLLERGKEWHSGMTMNYLLTQLLVISPLITLPLVFRKGFFRSTDAWERGLLFQFWGTLVFFLLMSFRGPTEGNWTLIVELILVIWLYRYLSINDLLKRNKWYAVLLGLSVILVQGIRVQLFTPLLKDVQGVMREVHTDDRAFLELANKANGKPIVFMNTYQLPARYMFVTGETATCHTAFYYRPNHFNVDRPIMDYPDSVVLVGAWRSELGGGFTDSFQLDPWGEYKLNPRSGYTSYLDLRIEVKEIKNETVSISISGEWPDLDEPSFFWLVEFQNDKPIGHQVLGPSSQNTGLARFDIPELQENTDFISICAGPADLYPEPNGYKHPLK